MSPEQVNGEQADHRGDLYAVGMILYLMLSGQFPYPGVDNASDTSILSAHALIEPEPLTRVVADVPEELSAIVLRLLAKDPAERYQSAETAADELSVFLRGSVAPDDDVARRLVVERRNAVARAQWRLLETPAARDPGGERSTMPLGAAFKPVSPCAFVPEDPWASERMADAPPAPSRGPIAPPAVVPRGFVPPALADTAPIVTTPDAEDPTSPWSRAREARSTPGVLTPAPAPQRASRAEPVSTGRAWAPVSKGRTVVVVQQGALPSAARQLALSMATGAALAIVGVGGVVVWARVWRTAAPAAAASATVEAPDAGAAPNAAPADTTAPAAEVADTAVASSSAAPAPTLRPRAHAAAPKATASSKPAASMPSQAPVASAARPLPVASATPPAVDPAPAPAASAPKGHRLFGLDGQESAPAPDGR